MTVAWILGTVDLGSMNAAQRWPVQLSFSSSQRTCSGCGALQNPPRDRWLSAAPRPTRTVQRSDVSLEVPQSSQALTHPTQVLNLIYSNGLQPNSDGLQPNSDGLHLQASC